MDISSYLFGSNLLIKYYTKNNYNLKCSIKIKSILTKLYNVINEKQYFIKKLVVPQIKLNISIKHKEVDVLYK